MDEKNIVPFTHINDNQDYSMAVSLLKDVKARIKEFEAYFADAIQQANAAHKSVLDARNQQTKPLEDAEKFIKNKICEFLYNLKSDETGIIPYPPKVEGITVIDSWGWTVEDQAKIPPEFLIPDEKAISKIVNSVGDLCSITGIKVFRKKSVRVNL